MYSKTLNSLILLLYTPLILTAPPQNKLEFLFSQIYEPYQYHLESANSFKNDIIHSFQSIFLPNISALLDEPFDLSHETYTNSQSFPNKVKAQQYPLLSKPDQPDLRSELASSAQNHYNVPEHPARMLVSRSMPQYFCLNGGIVVEALVESYFCTNMPVTKEIYLKRNREDCFITKTPTTACYCAQDFYGEICESYNPVQCEPEILTFPPEKCPSQGTRDSKYYSYSLNGERPCYSIKRDTVLKMDFKLNCKYMRPELGFEGIKAEDRNKYELKEGVDIPTFRYNVDEPNLKMTYFYPFVMKLRFIDWSRLSFPYEVELAIDGTHLSGTQNVLFNVGVVSETVGKGQVGGRYYWELVDIWNTWMTHKVSGVIEDADYVEPVNLHYKDKYRVWRKIGICAVVILIIAAVFIWRYIARNKEEAISRITLKSVYFQLTDEHEISVGNISTDVPHQ